MAKADRFLAFLEGMIVVDPDERHLPGQLLQHPYLSDAAQVCDLQPSVRGAGRVDARVVLAHENNLGFHKSGDAAASSGHHAKAHDHHPGNFDEDMIW